MPPTSVQGFAIRTAQLKAELSEQGRRVQSQLEASLSALFDRRADQAQHAIAMDDAADAADVRIEQGAVALLTDATKQGAEIDASHLRQLLTVVKVNNELERIADVAVDIAELVPGVERIAGPFPDTFRMLANSVVGILRDVVTSVERQDPALANIVLQNQHNIWAFKGALLKEAETRIAAGALTVDFAFALHEIASMCEMIADHCANIAEQVIYQTTGAIVRHMETRWVEVARPGS